MTTDKPNSQVSADQLLAEAEKLIWGLLDNILPQSDVLRLNEMIEEHDSVRELYLDCVQLHANLTGHFAQDPRLNVTELQDSPVLGSLGEAMSDVDVGPPVSG